MMKSWITSLNTSDNNSGVASETVKVLIIMGQSNIDGRNLLVDLPADITNPSSLVKLYNSGWQDWNSTKPPGTGRGDSSAYSSDIIATQRLATSLGETIYVVKVSQGGTHFYKDTNDINQIDADWNIASTGFYDLYPKLINSINNAENYIKASGKKMEVVGLWCDIFESDSIVSTKAQLNIDFKDFINAIRTRVGKPNLPIIHRAVSINQLGYVVQDIIDLQTEFATQGHPNYIENYNLIPSTDITMQVDNVHLDSASTEIIADRVLPILTNIYQN